MGGGVNESFKVLFVAVPTPCYCLCFLTRKFNQVGQLPMYELA